MSAGEAGGYLFIYFTDTRFTDTKTLARLLLQSPVDTRRRFNVDTMSYDIVSTLKRRRVSQGERTLRIALSRTRTSNLWFPNVSH